MWCWYWFHFTLFTYLLIGIAKTICSTASATSEGTHYWWDFNDGSSSIGGNSRERKRSKEKKGISKDFYTVEIEFTTSPSSHSKIWSYYTINISSLYSYSLIISLLINVMYYIKFLCYRNWKTFPLFPFSLFPFFTFFPDNEYNSSEMPWEYSADGRITNNFYRRFFSITTSNKNEKSGWK